jgi:hypothetical protein
MQIRKEKVNSMNQEVTAFIEKINHPWQVEVCNRLRQMVHQSIRQVLVGEIYTDEDCSLLLEDEYIHIYKYPRRKNDFVYLLERKFAEDFIIGVKIIDCIYED